MPWLQAAAADIDCLAEGARQLVWARQAVSSKGVVGVRCSVLLSYLAIAMVLGTLSSGHAHTFSNSVLSDAIFHAFWMGI